ncbi:MAG: DUF2784 domain-containing protein [Betaproteobacteria bacterium]
MRFLADLVVLLHAGFALFAVFGGLLAWRWRWIPWVHLPAAAWGAYVEFASRVCPLTPLENRLRAAGGAAAYRGDFIAHYLVPVLYPDNLTHDVQLGLGTVVIAFNILVYATLWRRSRKYDREG